MGSLPGAWVKMRRSSTGRLGAEELGRMGFRCLLLASRFQETLRILNTLRSPIGCGSSILPKGHTHDSFLFPSLYLDYTQLVLRRLLYPNGAPIECMTIHCTSQTPAQPMPPALEWRRYPILYPSQCLLFYLLSLTANVYIYTLTISSLHDNLLRL